MEQITIKMALLYILVMSLIGFAQMGIDKRKSINHAWRIPERTLILQAFLGGGVGSFLGMYTFRHKTKHRKFVILVPLAALIYLVAVIKLISLY